MQHIFNMSTIIYIEVNLIFVAAFGLLAGSGVVALL